MTEINYQANGIKGMLSVQSMDIEAGRVDDLLESEINAFNHVKKLLTPVENDTEEYAVFRADIINGLVQSFKQPYEIVANPTPAQVKVLESVLFTGGHVDWLGEQVAVKPFIDDYLQQRHVQGTVVSREFGQAVIDHANNDFVEGLPKLFGDGSKHDNRRSMTGRLVISQLAEEPLIGNTEQDITDAVEQYRSSGTVLSGAVDQFVDFGDGETITEYFTRLNQAQNQPVLNRVVDDGRPYSVAVIFQDGSMRYERLNDSELGAVRISYRSKEPIEVPNALIEGENGHVGKVLAGYESFKHVPYLPLWMLDVSFASEPCTAELEVSTDGYILDVYAGFKAQ